MVARGLGVVALVCVALILGLVLGRTPDAPSGNTHPATFAVSTRSSPTLSASDLSRVEHKVLAVLDVVDRTGQPPAGYRGGTPFMNDGRDRGEVLPRRSADGRPVTYREWDVNPYTGANRGTERLVTGSDGSAWYTNDHYNTFVRIR